MQLVSHPMGVKNGEEILVMPVGDVQWSGDRTGVALGMLKRHIQWGVDKGAYFLGMGDYIDSFSPSNRGRLREAALYDTAVKSIDDLALKYVSELYEEALAPSKGRWLGLLEGHHYHDLRDGTTTDQTLARMLDAPFLGTAAYVRLAFTRVGNGKGGPRRGAKDKPGTGRGSCLIWCHHGLGGGKRVSSPLNQLDQLPASWAGDVFLFGHHHKKVSAPIDYQEPVFSGRRSEATLRHRTKILACTGSFMKGYIPNRMMGQTPRGSYVESAALPPVALGGILLKIRPVWTEHEFRLDMNVEL